MRWCWAVVFFGTLAIGTGAWGQQSASESVGLAARTNEAALTLLASEANLPHGETTSVLGLEFVLQPGWKIYWHQPGAGGRPPHLDWQASKNIAMLRFDWPKPMRFTTYGFLSRGYADRVVLPIYLERARADAGVWWDVVVHFYICREVCIPDQVRLTGWLPAQGEQAAENPSARLRIDASALEYALSQTPKPYSGAMQVSLPIALRGDQQRWRLEWSVESAQPQSYIDAFFAAEVTDNTVAEYPDFQPPLINFSPDRRQFTIATEVAYIAIDQPVQLYLDYHQDGQERFEVITFEHVTPQGLDWPRVMLFALLGGLIINVMPCVLPVLMLKIFSLLRHYTLPPAQRAPMRGSLLAVASGIVISFAALGGIFALLRQTGGALHWGMQFQQPLFLSLMIFVLCLFAAQLWGWWSWHLPARISNVLAILNRGSSAHDTKAGGRWADFCTGVLATILATPCSAPFMGLAISVALFAEAPSLIIIFTGMGLGMALPYLVLALLPLARLTSRGSWQKKTLGMGNITGRWMVYVQWLMGFGVLGTALWMVWLLAQVIGAGGAWTIAGIAALILAVCASKFMPDTKISLYRWRLIVLLCVLGVALPGRFSVPTAAPIVEVGWQPFAPQDISAQVSQQLEQGKIVLIDISAQWCITCLVNDQQVFDQPEIVAWRSSEAVVAIRGDWSQPDEEIARYLRRYQRQALPFAIIHTPYAPEGLILPELLSMTTFLAALDQVKAPLPERQKEP